MNTPPEDPVMCHCSGTRKNNIQTLFEQGMDMQAISRWTGALSGCGGCEWDIAAFLKTLAEQRNSPMTKSNHWHGERTGTASRAGAASVSLPNENDPLISK